MFFFHISISFLASLNIEPRRLSCWPGIVSVGRGELRSALKQDQPQNIPETMNQEFHR